MEPAPTFRSVTPSDIGFIWKMYSETTRPHIQPLLKSDWNDREQETSFLSWWKAENTLLICLENTPVGWISFHKTDGIMVLEHLCVDPDSQGQGIGSAALAHVLENHRDADLPVITSPLKGSPLIGHLRSMGFAADPGTADDSLTITLSKA